VAWLGSDGTEAFAGHIKLAAKLFVAGLEGGFVVGGGFLLNCLFQDGLELLAAGSR